MYASGGGLLVVPFNAPHLLVHVFVQCSKKTCDYVFDDNLNWNCPFATIFWHTYYWEYRPSTGVFIFPPYLFHGHTVPWETVET